MAQAAFSHYFEFDPTDPDAGVSLCGLRKTDARPHTTQPTCVTCADRLRADDQAEEVTATLLAAVLDRVYAAMGERRG